jgi:uncharacterized membrane protein YdjX (TVP38/TMEM64 family)
MRLSRLAAWLIGIVAIAAVLWIVWAWCGPVIAWFHDRAAFQAWLASLGAWAPLVGIVLNAAQVIAAPIPGQVIGLANGYLFGAWLGTLYSLIGVMLGTGIVLALTRKWGRPVVVRLVRGEQLQKLDRLVARRGALFFFLIFLLPFLPDDLTCFAIGLTDLPLGQMLVLIALGRLPGLFVASWLGANATNLSLPAWIALIAGASLVALTYLRWSERIESRLLTWLDRLTRQHKH